MTDRAFEWIKKYLEARHDSCEAVFGIIGEPRRLITGDIWRFFNRHREIAKITKRLTPLILQHAATNLVF